MPIKLNLGCGKKLLDGWVNVDIEDCKHYPPDVVCDITDLSVFPDNYADEIMSVHVIEHIDRWRVDAMLKEWMRVLKPGGLLVIECPNLYEACRTLLAAGQEAAMHDKRGQSTMWPLYGDPLHENPYMMHRWGYTPYSLKELLKSCGFIGVKQAKAQFKKREPRDMRIEAVKP